jgi:plasmid maintenance system antidote protein VapI
MSEKPRYNKKDLGKRLYDLIQDHEEYNGIRKAARALRVDPAHISKIVNGKGSMSIDFMDRICHVFNTTPGYLMYGLGQRYYSNEQF